MVAPVTVAVPVWQIVEARVIAAELAIVAVQANSVAADPGVDAEEAIRRRLDIYHDQTEPLKDYYADRELLITVDAEQEIPKVTSCPSSSPSRVSSCRLP